MKSEPNEGSDDRYVSFVDRHIAEHQKVVASSLELLRLQIAATASIIVNALADGKKVLAFGNGGSGGPATTLYFTAGTFGESHGIFGMITPHIGM